ncbi:MAG TPA: hypothetical protein VFF70_14740, partial [Anaerolineae bacterium]|nr:hypothetical protein [Anaerolineae bacterium]
ILLGFFGPDLIPGIQGWYFLLGGAAAWGALTFSIIKDPEMAAQVAAGLLRQKFEPTTLRSPDSRDRLIKAFEYRGRIAEAIEHSQPGVLRDHLKETSNQIDDWIANLFSVAKRLDAFEGDRTIQQDVRSVPQAIQTTQARLSRATDPALRAQIDATLQSQQSQWTSLQNLESTIERGKLQMDATLSSMGTIYTQLLLMDAKDIDSGRAQRLHDDITEQVQSLHEVVAAMDEVYQYKK